MRSPVTENTVPLGSGHKDEGAVAMKATSHLHHGLPFSALVPVAFSTPHHALLCRLT